MSNKIIRKLYIWLLCGVVLVSLAGCITLKKGRPPKLVREKSIFGEARLPIVTEIHTCQQRYKVTFVYWEKWMDELIDRLGKNRKRDIYCREQSLLCLKKLESYLVDEKKESLGLFIAEFEEMTLELMERRLSEGKLARLKRAVEKHRRDLKRQFSYAKAKDWIRPDVEELPAEYLEDEDEEG